MTARFLERAKAALKDYDEEDLEAEAGECPVCNEGTLSPHTLRICLTKHFSVLTDQSGRVLACGHEACFGESAYVFGAYALRSRS